MRHLQIGRKLGVSAPHRKAMMRSLTLALIEKEAIKTTPARAKELRWFADHVVTLAKRGDVAARRQIVKLLGSTQTSVPGENRVRNAIERIYTHLVPRFDGRNGGYTQMVRLAPRWPGDNAELCLMRYLPATDEKKEKPKKEKAATKKVSAKSAAPSDKAESKPKTKKAKATT